MLPPLKEILQFRRPNVVDDEKKKIHCKKNQIIWQWGILECKKDPFLRKHTVDVSYHHTLEECHYKNNSAGRIVVE